MSRSDKLLLNLKSNVGHSIEMAGIIIHRHILAKNAKIIRFKEEIDSQSIQVGAEYLKRVDLFCGIPNSNSLRHYVRRSHCSSVTKKDVIRLITEFDCRGESGYFALGD